MDRRLFLATASLALLSPQRANAQTLPPDVSSATPHPSLPDAIAHLERRRWQPLSDLVVSLPPESASHLLDDMGNIAAYGVDLSGLDRLPMGNTIAAGLLIGWAWRFRGHGVASTVTDPGLQGFVAQLQLAGARIDDAIAADPDDGVARALGFRVSMGLSDKAALYSGLQGYLFAARRPVGGLSAFANAISRKWLGSEEEALGFARSVQTVDLPASAAVVADAHYVAWESRVMARQTIGDFSTYLAQPEIHAELLRLDDAFNSVGPDPDAFANWEANGMLSFALISLNELERARPHLLNLGNRVVGPWANLPNPHETLNAIRHHMGLERT